MRRIVPHQGMVITEDTIFEAGSYDFAQGEGIVIDADNITVDGNGALLSAAAPRVSIPDSGDGMFTPGDLGLCREEHELLLRKLPVEAGAFGFEYRFWGMDRDPSTLLASCDGKAWTQAARIDDAAIKPGWRRVRWDLGALPEGNLQVKLAFPAEAVTPRSPCFFDGFLLIRDGRELLRFDPAENWHRWYATGFSVYKRGSHGLYQGVAVRGTGRRGVHLRNLRVQGFLTALALKDCEGWTVERNDFSGNYDDPEYGWGEGNERHGAMHLEGVRGSLIRGNRAERVWNGIVLRRCAGNRIERNTVTHCSNTCLKMSQSTGNTVADNVLSWGLRIAPGEVHARDSVSLLVESGSDGNRFLRNDFSHGGDGIFIRVLNNWCSTGNLFEGNDCSHANNNAIEAWSPGNTYLRNKASRSSYGFWLGGSDDTVLIGNEVMHNGEERCNAPEPFGNAGISVVHGSSSGFVVCGNRIEENRGPGLSVAFTDETPARGWLVVGNSISNNRDDPRGYRGHGVLLEYCDGATLLGNTIEGNEGRQVDVGRSCRNVALDGRHWRLVEGVRIESSSPIFAGEEAELSLAFDQQREGVFDELSWDFGDSGRADLRAPSVRHAFVRPGTYRVCATAMGRGTAGAASRVLCVLPRGRRLVDCCDASGWRLRGSGAALDVDRDLSVMGKGALLVTARAAGMASLRRELPESLDLASCAAVSFFFRYACELFVHTGKRGRRIGLRLHSADRGFFECMPEIPPFLPRSEDRYEWVYFRAEPAAMRAEGSPDPSRITDVEILFGPEEPADFVFRLDAISIETA